MDSSTKLTPHFTLGEMTASEISRRNGIPNVPTQGNVACLVFLCLKILEPLRAHVGVPIIINSGFRNKVVNDLVGGVSGSYHLLGKAADIQCAGKKAVKWAHYLKSLYYTDLVIIEPGWIHVQWSNSPRHKLIDARKKS